MPKAKLIVATLLLTNAIAGAGWWRSHSKAKYWQAEERASSNQYDIAAKETELLQEAIISEKVSSLKLFALNNTEFGKCVSENPDKAQNHCAAPERVVKGHQKILQGSGSSNFSDIALLAKIGQSLKSSEAQQREASREDNKMNRVCSWRETSSQCVLYKNLQHE